MDFNERHFIRHYAQYPIFKLRSPKSFGNGIQTLKRTFATWHQSEKKIYALDGIVAFSI
jgi:hypothetical protein